VICLQEVTPPFSQALRASQLLSATYAISDNDVGRYGCLILAKHELGPRFSEIEMATMMGRSLLVAELVPPGGGGSARAWCAGAVATVHLESLNSAKVRDAQLQTANRALARYLNAVLCGDFNFGGRGFVRTQLHHAAMPPRQPRQPHHHARPTTTQHLWPNTKTCPREHDNSSPAFLTSATFATSATSATNQTTRRSMVTGTAQKSGSVRGLVRAGQRRPQNTGAIHRK